MNRWLSVCGSTRIVGSVILWSAFSWFPTITQAQTDHVVDSLAQLVSQRGEDTTKVKLQLDLSQELQARGNYEGALRTSLEARALALRLGFASGVGCSWLASGRAYLKKNEYDSALTHLRKALSVFEVISDKSRQGVTHMSLGLVFDYQARYSVALQEYKTALDLLTYPQDATQILQTWNFMGNSHFNKGSYDIALEYYLRSYKGSLEVSENTPFSAPLNNIGVVYALMSQYDEALKYFLKYFESIEHQASKRQERSGVLLNIGECYNKLGNPKQALPYLSEAIIVQKELIDRRGLSLSYSNLADSYRLLNQDGNAEYYYKESIKLARRIKNQEVLLNPLLGISRLYLENREATKAEATIQEALRTSESIKSKIWEEKALLLASKLDSVRGDDRGSLKWFKRYFTLHDSLFSEQRSRQVIEVRELYEAEKKEKEIKLLSEARKFEELKRKGDQNIFYISIAFLILAILSIGYWAVSKTRDSRMLQQQKDAVASANKELTLLLGHIEQQNKTLASKNEILQDLHHEKDGLIGIVAHDLRSPLNRITGLTNLVELCGELNADQKTMLTNIKKVCTDGNSLIQDLLDINHYETTKKLDLAEIEVTQFMAVLFDNYIPAIRAKHLTLHYNYDRTKRAKIMTDQECLVRIVDNLLTNAIKFSPVNKNIYVTIGLEQQDRVSIKIRDEGPGFQEEDLPHLFKKFKKLSARPTAGESSTGLGLSIVKSLVDRLGGKIAVSSTAGNGAEFILTFEATVYAHSMSRASQQNA